MFHQEQRLIRSGLAAILLSLLVVFHGIPGHAEILPTHGTFRGLYHVNRAGVGRFIFFIISKALKGQMAPYDGKYVEVEILKARQPFNPGPAIVDKIGKVTRLPDPPLTLQLQTVFPGARGGKTIDVIYSLTNVGKKDTTINANDLQIGVRRYSRSENDEAQDDFFQTGYTRRQLGFGGSLSQRWNFIFPPAPGKSTHFNTGMVLLRPGETAPFVLHGMDFKPGQYELAFMGAFRRTKNDLVPVMAVQSLDVPLPQHKRIRDELLDARVQVTHDREWLIVDGRIFGKPEAGVALFTLPDGARHFLPGLLQCYSSSGDRISARLDWQQPNGPWRRILVDREGVPFKFRVRRTYHFSRKRIAKIGFWTVTDRGIEKLTLADGLPKLPQRPLPPWGKTEQGCRLRVQMAGESFRAREPVRFFFQAESNDKNADIVWIDRGNRESHVVVTVDGKKARTVTGISDGIVYSFPFQREIKLSSVYKVLPGKHRLQLSVRGDPGTYTNLFGRKSRKFGGTLVSNVVEFEVQREE